MSVNQSRGDKNEPPHYRRSGRSVNHASPMNFSGDGGKGGGGGSGSTTAPPSSAFSSGVTVKPTDASVQKSSPGLPKAPQSHAVTPISGITGATGPATPGPPNMDEQKRAQARLDSLKATSFTNPAVPKQQLPRKDVGPANQPNIASETRPSLKEKKDVSAPIAAHNQKPTGPPMPSIPGVSMQIPFHQSQIHLPFGGPNPPLQSQNMANTSFPVPLPMHLPVGNPPQVPPQVFVQGIQHHHHQGMIHPSQGLTFSSQIGNMRMPMGLGPQFQQQLTMANLNFGGARRTLKITHPDTQEELRLDKRTDGLNPNGGSSGGPRSHPQGPPQSRTVPSFLTAHPTNYYPNSYNANPIYFPPHGKQNTPGSQPRFFNQQQACKQVTVKPAVCSLGEKVGDSSSAVVKIEIPKSQRIGVEVTSTHPHKNLETIAGSSSPAPVEEDATSLVNSETEVAKKATVNSSGSLKEEQKQPSKKAMSIPVEKIDEQSSVVSSSSVGHHRSIDSGVQKASKGKKKIKEILKNADARGTTSDLYHVFKRPEEKKETSLADERRGPRKFEPDDWEDVADISFPIMETGLKRHSEDDNDGMTKKYSRDFLLKFLDHCTDLPEGFEIDITKFLIASSVDKARPGRGGNRSGVGSQLDRQPSNVGLDDKWSEGPGPMVPGWDPRLGYGANHGVLRTPRGQPSGQPPGQYAGGILSGPMQPHGPHGGPMQRNNSDSDM